MACIRERRSAYSILVARPEGNSHLEDLAIDGENLFIYFNPASHTCVFGHVKNITQSNILCSVIKNIYTIQRYSKTILEKLYAVQNDLYINIDNYE